MQSNTKVIVFSVVLAMIVCMAFSIGLVVVFVVIPNQREAARREQAVNNLRSIGTALHNYEEAADKFPAFHEGSVPFDTYSGYFVSNQFEPDAAESFVIIRDQEQFDRVFGVAAVMNDQSHRLPDDAFASHLVLAVVKRGTAVVEYRVADVTDKVGVVELRYTTTSKEDKTAEFASPLIVSIPKTPYLSIRFVENQKMVKEIKWNDEVDEQANNRSPQDKA